MSVLIYELLAPLNTGELEWTITDFPPPANEGAEASLVSHRKLFNFESALWVLILNSPLNIYGSEIDLV